jgi:hypothetical protein
MVATVGNLNGRVGMASQAVANAAEIQGTASINDRDNIIDLGAGDDVLVLSSDGVGAALSSVETIRVVGDSIGSDVIVNFTSGANGDRLDFSSHLTGKATNTNAVNGAVAGNTLENKILITLGGTGAIANSVVVLAGEVFTATDTFAGLTAANFLSSINTTGRVNYANLADADLQATHLAGTAFANGTLVGTTYNVIAAVENAGNLGQYKMFKLTGTIGATATTDFTSAVLLGTMDFGNSLGGGFTAADNLVA